jgi:type IV secretory pathway VirB10-like protein
MLRRSLLLAALVLVGVVLWSLALDQRPVSDEPAPIAASAPAAPEMQPVASPEVERTQPRPPADEQESEPAEPAAPQAPPTAQQPPEDTSPLPPPKQSGPVAKMQQAFAEQPRDSAAHDPESRIESEFRRTDIAPGTLKSVLCRASVCKVEVLWTPERAMSFMAAFTRLSADFDPGIAIDPHSMTGTPPQLQVDVYLPRRGAQANP